MGNIHSHSKNIFKNKEIKAIDVTALCGTSQRTRSIN